MPPGSSGLLSARPEPDLAAHGYSEVEHVVSGRAVSYGAGERGLPGDGRFDLHEGEQADYATRVVVRRPEGETRASGTLVAEWLNVSSGADTAPDWTFTCEEILRAGHTWVGVSVQHVGVEGGGGSVSVGALPPPPGLRGTDAQRYGDLHHPGDAFALDIFTQAVAAVRDLVAADVVLLVGESQSAFCLTTYANGVQPLTGLADAILLHSRGATAAPLGVPGVGLRMEEVLASHPVVIRDDLAVPVLVVQTEGDLFDRIGFLPARQPDSDRLRLWEIAGAAHADHYVIGEFEAFLGSPVPVNRGQQAPTQVVSGRAWPGAPVSVGLFGSTTPLDGLSARHPSVEAYLASYAHATDVAIAAGFVLAEDREQVLAEARPDLVESALE